MGVLSKLNNYACFAINDMLHRVITGSSQTLYKWCESLMSLQSSVGVRVVITVMVDLRNYCIC